MQKQEYKNCKYYCSKTYCPHINEETMKNACVEIPESFGTTQHNIPHPPSDEDINNICSSCDKFTQK